MTNSKDIEPKLKSIHDYLELDKSNIFAIPEYQRSYSWNIEQCDKLWQDIENFIDTDDGEPYFFGTIIMDCSDNDGKLKLIDGQQRTTTFFLLLKGLQLKLKDTIANFNSTEDSKALEKGLNRKYDAILEILYKADDDKLVKISENWENAKGTELLENMSINEQYAKDFQIILEAKNFDEAESNVCRLYKKQKDNKYTNFFKNFKYFYNKLCDYSESKLNNFADAFLNKCQVIEIRSWKMAQAIAMFNSLNSTGLPLRDADIISAQLAAKAENDKNEFESLWKDLIKRSSDLENNKIITIDSVLQEYMYICRAKNNDSNATTPSVRAYYTEKNKKLLDNPIVLCKNFLKIVEIWENIKSFPIIRLLLKFNENSKFYLISFLNRYEAYKIPEADVLKISECLLRLFAILELVESGYSSKNFKAFLFKENLNLVNSEISIDDIEKDFDKHIVDNWHKDEIKNSLENYDKNILVYLNEYVYAKNKGLNFDFSESVNIEHIMPNSGHNKSIIRNDANISENDFDYIVNKLGNKILLEENINKSIGNEWFKTKKQNSVNQKIGYKDSSYNIAKVLVDYPKDTWTKDDIERASQKIYERIIKFLFNE